MWQESLVINDSYDEHLGTVEMLTSKLLLFFFMKEKAPGAGKTDIRLPETNNRFC